MNRFIPPFYVRVAILFALGWFLAGLASNAHALKLTTVEVKPDGTTSTTTYEVSDSLGASLFRGVTNPAYIVDATSGATGVSVVSFADRAGNVFTLGPAGEVYRNGLRLTALSSSGALQKMLAQKIVQFGPEIFAKGKTDNLWWRWDGSATVNKWVAVSADFDTSVLK